MLKWLIAFLLLPSLVTAQLKEFEVSEMEPPDVAVLQGNAQWPNDALLFVYSSLKDLNFRSSLGGIDKVTYNPKANRYEILFKPNKQMLFVYASNFVEQKIETFNPNPKDVFYYKVEEKQQAVVNTKPGTLKIVTEPSGADVFVNGMRMADKTPFEGEPNPGSTRIKLQKANHETIDTTVVVRAGQSNMLNILMKSTMREPSAMPTEIGQAYGGGIVFEINEDGHGLVVAMEDLGEFSWGVAKIACESYVDGGYADWYLPAIDELRDLYRQRNIVNSALSKEGGEQLRSNQYWSSTVSYGSFPDFLSFYNGAASLSSKSNSHNVRAIRAF